MPLFLFGEDAKKSLCIMEEIHKLKGDFYYV